MTLQQAAQAFNSGHLRAANQLCQQVLANQPTNPEAMNLMGAIVGVAGRHDLAAEWLRKAIQLRPQDLMYRTNYLSALLRLDQIDNAAALVGQSLRLFPDHPVLLTLQGVVLGRQADHEAAIEKLQQAISINPNLSNAHFNLSVIYRRQGEDEKSLEHLKRAVELDPNSADAINDLAGVLLADGEFMESLRQLQRYLQLQPRSALGYYNLSVALEAAGDGLQSSQSLRNALAIDPMLKRARFKLASQLVARGEFDEAGPMLEQWEHEEPDNPRVLALKSRYFERQGKIEDARAVLDRVAGDGRDISAVRMTDANLLYVEGQPAEAAATLEKVVEQNDTDALELIGVRFSLGKFYDAIGEYDKAFTNYESGNEARKKAFAFPFDPAKSADSCKTITKTISRAWKTKPADCGYRSNMPIFIVGMPRSGTSLTEQIFGAHSKVQAAGELRTFAEAVKATHGDRPAAPEGQFTIVEHDVSGYQNAAAPKDFEPETLDKIGETYVNHISSLAEGLPHVSDKMPFNYLFAPIINLALPDAKIIHMRRNPLDTCVSCYFQNFSHGSEFAFDLDHLVFYYQNYLQVMETWRELPVEMLEIDYEELVSDTEKVVRQMFDFCELEFEPACLESHKNPRPVATASYQQVREPINKKSVARWKHYEQHMQPIIEALALQQ